MQPNKLIQEPSATALKYRIQSVDILRGIIMIIMALDHVRDFFHIHGMDGDPTDMATTTPLLFFTRWVTHFCAPTFVFLSGISAYLSGLKKTKAELRSFLIKRGLWLILVEMVVVTFGITFNPFYNIIILQVIWAIGLSMIILGLFVGTSPLVILITGAVIFLGHNIFDYVKVSDTTTAGKLFQLLVVGPRGVFPISSNRMFLVFYTAIPWTGVMLLGYSAGRIFNKTVDSARRQRLLTVIGLTTVAAFIILRLLNSYGDPAPWSTQKDNITTFLSFLNTTKYPPSIVFSCMTIGPSILLLAFFEKRRSKLTDIFTVYGKVPFFYYIIHFYSIHVLCMIVFFASGHRFKEAVDPNSFAVFRPFHFGFELPVVYLIWIGLVVLLYKPCKRFSKYRATHSQWWLSYL
ncbi:heparan-alpha-glucosaminide N-acetyltransferase domain-containing protein [Danxiaibacter flavus]|uniref:Heparan-alpha-glucosaminide N-acetyltransferase domain-containing protein n=1 Tax=Danxiaibacter flavus TaxID=3049108 RepID=A0ABV3ZM13_9BACT|nr:heparan-alpha-glucosaminide N-acetyltransferase domain-containing protein [Chitinophagaceae bacterium DXS]